MINTKEFPFSEVLEKIYIDASYRNEEAYKFLIAFNKYCHGIDDIIDEDIKDKESIVAVFFTAGTLFSSNFWMAYGKELYIVLALITNDYLDSENPNEPLKDLLRFSGNNMIKAVAFILGGYEHMRSISYKLNLLSFKEHHDLTSLKPI